MRAVGTTRFIPGQLAEKMQSLDVFERECNMGAVSLQLGAIFQETIGEGARAQSTANATPVNPNQSQGAPAPQDTVTLTGQVFPGQLTQQNSPQQVPFQGSILFATAAQVQVFAAGNNGNTNTQAPEAPAIAQVQTQTQLQHPATGALATGNTANTGGAAQGSQQELQQLDQTLQQLGIDPQSISLFNRLALLLYANDPAALQQFVQQLQNGSTQVGEGTGATPIQTQPQAQNPEPPQNQTADPGQAGSLAQVANSAPTAAPDQAPATGQAAAPNQNQAQTAAPSSFFVQFEELQLTFAGNSGQTQPFSYNRAASSNPNQSGFSLNLTA